MYFLPVVISDNDYPIQSSTSTLIVRVCACDSRGNMQSCNPEVLPFSDGLTTGALVAILLCVIILLSKLHLCARSDQNLLFHFARSGMVLTSVLLLSFRELYSQAPKQVMFYFFRNMKSNLHPVSFLSESKKHFCQCDCL